MDLDAALDLVIGLAHEFSLETRIRRLIQAHQADGSEPRTLVMNAATWRELAYELEGRSYTDNYFWAPAQENSVTFFRGLPILIKEYIADQEVIVGV